MTEYEAHQEHIRYTHDTPPRGAYRLFLLSSPPAVSVEQKSAWDWCGIFNYVKLQEFRRIAHLQMSTFGNLSVGDIVNC